MVKYYFKNLVKSVKELPVTSITIGICIIVFLVHNFMRFPLAYLLAYYRPMIFAGEYWRLITCGLTHTQLWHMFMNLYGLWLYGKVFERELKPLKFFILLYGSILGGSLFLLFTPQTSLAVGISGGLYGLMAAIIVLYARKGLLANPTIRLGVSRLLLVNLIINFSPQVAVMAHLGGFVTGLILFMAMDISSEKSLKINSCIAGIILACVIGYYGFKNKECPNPRYYDFDVMILHNESQLGLTKHAQKVAHNLSEIYGTTIVEDAFR